MEEKIKVIQQVLEINEEEAKKALKLAENDLDKALKMEEYIAKNYLTIQVKFRYGGQNYNEQYGLISLIWNGKEGEVINTISVIDNKEKISDILIEVDHSVFMKALKQISEETTSNLEYQFKKGLEDQFNPTVIYQIFKFIKEETPSKVEAIIGEKIRNIIEEDIELELYAELITKEKLLKIYPEYFQDNIDSEDKSDNVSNDGNKKNFNLDINLNCVPVISATKGKRVQELSIGDKLKVQITDNKEIGKYLNNLLKDSSGTATAIIKNIELNKNLKRYSITVQFGPNIYGTMLVEPEVKISTISEGEKESKEFTSILANNKNTIIFSGIIIAIILLTVLFLKFYYL
ncbi:hypothetical protein [Orenia marismortui]|uniref:hypothetical protein n=1 Tax=Orenia marismortui TaxID=46469 RepID=UPI00036529EE|nr:hypothetical protein [Orenia marismortui]